MTPSGLGSIPPITFISARSLIAAFFLLAILRARGLRLPIDAKEARAPGDDEADPLTARELEAERRGEFDPAVELALRPQEVHDFREDIHIAPSLLAL